jgi:hypothetical protein
MAMRMMLMAVDALGRPDDEAFAAKLLTTLTLATF